ncbi:intestinal mucin-like protein [Pagrus major]|uniref:intestinal mucin-like protein n=1 Tax=Pagrus major TaxID=143350 RepID=UPI003CC893F4
MLSTTPTTTPPEDCPYLQPPRKHGDTWRPDNCTTSKCDNGSVITSHVECEKVTKPVCENGKPPVKIYDETGCCFHYECQCLCYGWGDPHYKTFDGQYYSFQENCTYVLVKEIIPRYNITILIDNENCDPSGSVTCVKALLVFYKNYNITLVLERAPKTKNFVYINNKQVVPTYSNDDLIITSTGIKLLLRIPAIGADVTLEGFFFTVQLPFSFFHNNTEGQCGYCDNNKKNDCRLPNGQIHPSCSGMGQWQVNVTNKPYCQKPPPTIPTPVSTSTPQPTCKAPICDILISKVFEECRKVISPDDLYSACQFDVCHTQGRMGCSSLELYASQCAKASICVAWRNATNGLCEYKCPGNKVYKPCEQAVEPTCNAR